MTQHAAPATIKKTSTLLQLTARQQLCDIAKKNAIDAPLLEEKPNTSFAQRAELREEFSNARRQQNLEVITAMTYERCQSDEMASPPDADWMQAYFSLACEANVKTMQQLWAQIWADELINHGSYSIRALHTLKQMTQREAQWFQHACCLSSVFGNELNHKIITSVMRPTHGLSLRRQRVTKLSLGQFRLPYHHILQLAELGLIYERELEIRPNEREFKLHYGHQQWLLQAKFKALRIGYYRFTPIGDELAKLIGTAHDDDYQHALLNGLSAFFELG